VRGCCVRLNFGVYSAMLLQQRVLPMDQAAQNVFWVTTGHLRSALFCDIMHRIVVIPHRRFGTTYRVPSWRVKKSKKKSPYGITTTRCVMTQKGADIVYFSAEAWIHLSIHDRGILWSDWNLEFDVHGTVHR